jgi:hypothetical protein
MARQRSNMRWFHDGDANTQFCHIHANHRRRKNHIAALQVDRATLVTEDDKEETAFNYFFDILGTSLERRASSTSWPSRSCIRIFLSYGPPWAHYLGGYQDRLLDGPLGLLGLGCTAPVGIEHKGLSGEVLR